MLPGKVLKRQTPPCKSHPARLVRIAHELLDAAPQLPDITGSDQITGLTVANDLRQPSNAARHDRRSAGHGFQDR